jgi:hypothetical protein
VRPSPALLAAPGLALALAGPAQASAAFELFKDFCLASRADPGVAIGKADAAGWSKLDAKILEGLRHSGGPEGRLADPDGRIKTDAGGSTAVMVGRAEQISPGFAIPARTCSILTVPADAAALKAEAAAYAAVPAHASMPGEPQTARYVWRANGQTRDAVELNALKPDAANDDVSMIVVSPDASMVLLGLAVPVR